MINVLADYLHQERTHFSRIAAAILRDPHAGEDMISSVIETFLRMPESEVAKALDRTPLEKYVASAVKHRAIDAYRKRQRRAVVDPALIEDGAHPDNTPGTYDSDKFTKYAAIVPGCVAHLESTHPKQGQAVRNFLALLAELDRPPRLDEQVARLSAEPKKLSCNLCLGLKALRTCIINKGGSDPFKK